MTDWPQVTLRRLVHFGHGQDHSAVEAHDGDFPVIGSGGEFARASAYLFNGESVLFGRKGTIDRPVYMNGPFWTVDTMYYTVLRPGVHAKWLYYWATTVPYRLYSTSTALPSMTSSVLGSLPLRMPSLGEQVAIADFLDSETAKIDALIEKQRRLGEATATRDDALIESAVLGRERRESHAAEPWLRTLQRDWGVTRLGYHFDVALGKMLDEGKQAPEGAAARPYLRAANIRRDRLDVEDVKHMPITADELRRLSLKAGDLLVVEGGATVGRSCLVPNDLPGMAYQKTLNRVRPKGAGSTSYLHYVLRWLKASGVIDLICDGSTFMHLTAEKLRALSIPWPSPPEQVVIAHDLDEALAQSQNLIGRIDWAIALAQERRSALITAAVTGQLDIGEAA